MRQWCVSAVVPPADLSPPLSEGWAEVCDMEPRYTIEQIDLLQRLRLSGMSKPQIIQALETLERLDSAPPTPQAPPTATPTSSCTTTQTLGVPNSLSPCHSLEASPPPVCPAPSTGGQRSYVYEDEWDLEEKVEEYMRRDSSLVKEEIKAFLSSRRISQAVVGQVTGISQSYISQWLLQQGLEMSDAKRRAFYRWYLLERGGPGVRWSESQQAQVSRPWGRQRELLHHLLPWCSTLHIQTVCRNSVGSYLQEQYTAHGDGSVQTLRSPLKEEPDWRSGFSPGGSGVGLGPLRLRRGSRFTWRKECQSLMETFFLENQYPDEAKREEIASACNSVIQKPGCKLSEFERVTALKVYNWFANRRKEMKRRANIEAAILESHGIEVASPSCQSNGEEAEVPDYAEQEEITTEKEHEQHAEPLAMMEEEIEEEDPKREAADEE